MRSPLVPLAAGLVLMGCNAHGNVYVQGRDPVGQYEASVKWNMCDARFAPAGTSGSSDAWTASVEFNDVGATVGSVLTIVLPTDARGAATGPPMLVNVSIPVDMGAEHYANFDLQRRDCSVYDVRQWVDAGGHMHAIVHLDCRPHKDVHVWGTAETGDCSRRGA